MSDTSSAVKGKAFNLREYIDYADGSVVSKTLIKKDIHDDYAGQYRPCPSCQNPV